MLRLNTVILIIVALIVDLLIYLKVGVTSYTNFYALFFFLLIQMLLCSLYSSLFDFFKDNFNPFKVKLFLFLLFIFIFLFIYGSFKGTDMYGRFCEIEKENCKVKILNSEGFTKDFNLYDLAKIRRVLSTWLINLLKAFNSLSKNDGKLLMSTFSLPS